MINRLLLVLGRFLLWLRYRVKVRGVNEVAARGRRGILFLPNHNALIDPVILMSRLWGPFHTRALADRNQVDRFFIRRLARRFRIIDIPDVDKPGFSDTREIREVVAECVSALRAGDNLILYPAGRLTRGRLEEIGGTSAVESILRELPDVRVVLVRTRGLWGSGFSFASGTVPDVPGTLRRGARALLLSGVFFAPRRRVDIELVERDDFPRSGDRGVINPFLEKFFNENAPRNTYVPHTIWEPSGVREVPEPERPRAEGELSLVPESIRAVVRKHLEEVIGTTRLGDDVRLAHDLGMDSLARMELIAFLQAEFGRAPAATDALETVGDVMLAASGQAVAARPEPLRVVPRAWFTKLPSVTRPDGIIDMTIPEAFLWQAGRTPGATIVADQTSGARSYRDVVLGALVLKDEVGRLPGRFVGVMLPASVAADVVYLSVLFAGRTPAMINWTLGRQSLRSCIESVGVERILTSRALVQRLGAQGIELDEFAGRFVYLEDVAAGIGALRKLHAWLRSRLSWRSLRRCRPPEIAAVLFTSGSEAAPKAVPLTHRNILANAHDAWDMFHARKTDSILGILPPFHSFGLTTSTVLPLTLGGRVVHHPNPTEGAALGRIIDAYKPTILMGTPTFLHGIVRSSTSQQLASLRLVVSGAEKCTPMVYEAVAKRCPQTVIIEGYGVTECSPVISANSEDDARPGTIGRMLGSLEYALVDADCRARVASGAEGMLLVRGTSVFGGYLNYSGPSPFVEFEGKSWYRTGDLVKEDASGWLTFAGRLKRFVKLGGEMVSLPAIESALEPRLVGEDDKGPVLAVVATADEQHPEIVLFTTKEIEREEANRCIREAGLSGLHNVRRVERIDALPTLGTGKTDYRTLAERLKGAAK